MITVAIRVLSTNFGTAFAQSATDWSVHLRQSTESDWQAKALPVQRGLALLEQFHNIAAGSFTKTLKIAYTILATYIKVYLHVRAGSIPLMYW